jgi:hypothetical protein
MSSYYQQNGLTFGKKNLDTKAPMRTNLQSPVITHWSTSKLYFSIYLQIFLAYLTFLLQPNFSVPNNSIETKNGELADEELFPINEDLVDWEYLKQDNLLTISDEDYSIMNQPMRDGTLEERDYIYISEQVWRYFSRRFEGAHEIRRVSWMDKEATRFDLYPLKVTFYLF